MSKNKVIFVTGAFSGLGLGLARELGKLGYKVYSGCFSTKLSVYDNVEFIKLDVISDTSCQKAITLLLSKKKNGCFN